MTEYFPNALRFNVLQFSSNVLLHMRSNPDIEMGNTGEILLPLLSKFRSVAPEYIDEYYEMVSGICNHLMTFASLCESCSKSGAYVKKWNIQAQTCITMIDSFEAQSDMVKLMNNMHRKSPA